MNGTVLKIPAGRSTVSNETTSKVFSWVFKKPSGKRALRSVKVFARLNISGTPGAAVRFHKLFKSFKLSGKEVSLEALEDAIPMTAVASHGMREDNNFEAAPGTTDIVRNPSVAAAATDYDFVWDCHIPAAGQEFVFSVDMDAVVNQISWATGASFDIVAIPTWTNYRGFTQYSISGKQHNSVSEKSFSNVDKIVLGNDANWTTLMGAIDLGESLTSEQVAILEDMTNDNFRGLAADSTGTTRTLPLADPADAAAIYLLAKELEKTGSAKLDLNTASTFLSVVFRNEGGV